MKKLFFGLLAMVLFSSAVNAQKMTDAASKNAVSAQMVALVSVSKALYVRGQSYEDFVKALLIPSPTVPSQEQLFRKVYHYVSKDSPVCEILTADNTVLNTFVNEISKNPKNQSTYEKVGDTGKKKWWQIAINWVFNTAVTLITTNQGINPPPPVDFFPDAD